MCVMFLALFILLYLCLTYILRKKKPGFFVVAIIIMNVWKMLCTLLQNGSIGTFLQTCVPIVLAAVIIDYYKKDFSILIKVLMRYFEVLIYLNFILIIIFPNGLFSTLNAAYGNTKEWLLGADNNFIFYLYPGLVVSLIYRWLFNYKNRTFFLATCILLTEIFCGSTTGLIGVILLLSLSGIPFLRKFLNPIFAYLLFSFLFFSIFIIQSYNYLEPIMVDVFNKDMTFTSRTFIWSNSFAAINKNWLGYGVLYNEQSTVLLGNINGQIWEGATHAHCQYLQVAFQGGVINTIVFVIINMVNFLKIKKYDRKINIRVFLFSIIVLLVMFIVEVFENSLCYLIIGLIFYVDCFVKLKKERQVVIDEKRI